MLHTFLTSTLGGGEWIVTLPSCFFFSKKKRALHYFSGSRDDLQVSEKIKSCAPAVNRTTIPQLSNP